MKTFTKHILLLALMLFGVAGAAWALPRAPQKFTGPVDIYDLMDGDTLASGFSLTYGHGQQEIISFVAGRYSIDGTPQAYPGGADLTNDHELQSLIFTASNILMYFGEERTDTIAPMVDMSTPGNAWVVSDFNKGTEGVTMKISGIYIAPDPTVPALDELTGNWNFLMPGSNKVVKAVLYDSIVLGPHVELYDAQPAFAAGDIYTRGDSTIYYYDTNNHHSFHLRADEQADGKYFGFWSDLDPTDDQYTDRTYRYVGPGFLTCGHRYTAAYPENHTLTLVTPQGGGTLELAGVGVDTVYTITFEQSGISGDSRSFTIPASRFPYDTTFSYNANIVSVDAYDQMHESVSMIPQSSNTVTVRINGPFKYGGYYECELEGGASDNWTISCTATGTQPKMPYGIRKTGDNTYSVMEGLTVNVTATPDSAHYLSAIGNEAVISNSAYNISFTMPDDDAELAATFTTKPTLTLDQTDGGTLEAIVPQGGVTAMHPTTDQIPTWDGNTEDAMAADLQQFGFVAVDSAAAAAWTGVPASGDIMLVYATAGNQFKAILFQDGQWHGTYTSNFYKGEIYAYTSSDMIYFTTGASKGNVIASTTEPNTYYIDYGTPVTVVATPDAEHYLVSFSDDAPATERNSNLAVEKTYDSVIADIPNLSATFQAKPTLTLTANDGGTLTLDGITTELDQMMAHLSDPIAPGTQFSAFLQSDGVLKDNVKTLTDAQAIALAQRIAQTTGNNNILVVASTFEFIGDKYLSYGKPDGNNEGGTATMTNSNAIRTIYYVNTFDLLPETYPTGVAAGTTANTYRVDYGTTLTVTATPDATHYLATLGEELVNSNDSIHRTFTMTAPVNLPADFRAKPTLTLAHNQGGEMEAIVPQGGVTAIVPPTDQISGWENDNAGYLTESDMPAELGFVAVDQAAAEAWTGAPATGDALLIYGINGENFYYLSFNDGSLTGNDDGFLTPGSFYQMASAGTLYFTTGVTPNNVTASTEPNTYYIDYNTSVTVKATPSDTAYLVRFDQDADTNSNTAVEKTYGPLTAALTTAEATFNDKPVLTLAANDTTWGKVSVDGVVEPSTTGIIFNVPNEWNGDNTTNLSAGDFPGFVSISEEEALNWQAPASGIYWLFYKFEGESGHYLVFYNGAYFSKKSNTISHGDYYYQQNYGAGTNIAYTTGAIPGGMPAGVAKLTDSTYRVDYGTEVTVQADATELHHVANWEDQNGDSLQTAAYSAYFITEPEPLFPDSSAVTFTVTTDTIAKAVFGLNYRKLYFSHNAGGMMEFVVAQDSMLVAATQEVVESGAIKVEADSADAEGMRGREQHHDHRQGRHHHAGGLPRDQRHQPGEHHQHAAWRHHQHHRQQRVRLDPRSGHRHAGHQQHGHPRPADGPVHRALRPRAARGRQLRPQRQHLVRDARQHGRRACHPCRGPLPCELGIGSRRFDGA